MVSRASGFSAEQTATGYRACKIKYSNVALYAYNIQGD